MELMEQCQIWHKNNEYQKIIDAILAVPDEKRTPELDSELARAYNNVAAAEDKELFQKAVELLKPHEEYFKGEHFWNFRIAYACYYLGQTEQALHYFKQALESRPGDENTQKFIDHCRRILAVPQFEKNFRQRTAECWTAFEQGEEKLRELLDQKDRNAVGEELLEKCNNLLS